MITLLVSALVCRHYSMPRLRHLLHINNYTSVCVLLSCLSSDQRDTVSKWLSSQIVFSKYLKTLKRITIKRANTPINVSFGRFVLNFMNKPTMLIF